MVKATNAAIWRGVIRELYRRPSSGDPHRAGFLLTISNGVNMREEGEIMSGTTKASTVAFLHAQRDQTRGVPVHFVEELPVSETPCDRA